jgi:hypothetical protein
MRLALSDNSDLSRAPITSIEYRFPERNVVIGTGQIVDRDVEALKRNLDVEAEIRHDLRQISKAPILWSAE